MQVINGVLDLTLIDIDESGLNDLLQGAWERGERQPDTIRILRKQVGVVIPNYALVEDEAEATGEDIVNTCGITLEQARVLIKEFAVKKHTIKKISVPLPSMYSSDFGDHKVEVV